MKTLALVVAALVLCASRAALAQSPAACVFDETQVPFARELTLFHTLPPAGAQVEYPFATLSRAARVRVTLPIGAVASMAASVEIESATVRLRGVGRASDVPVFMARPSLFGGAVIPLATRTVDLRQTEVGRALVALPDAREVSLRLPPEWRACGELRLRAAPTFSRAALTSERVLRRIPLAYGDWSIFEAPDESQRSRVRINEVRGGAWLLDTRPGGWLRVLWVGQEFAVLGWTSPRHRVVGLGHGSGTGSGMYPRTPLRSPLRCPRDLTLLADDRGTAREIGAIRAGASVSRGVARGPNTVVFFDEPGVAWADGVALMVPTEQLAGCAPVRL